MGNLGRLYRTIGIASAPVFALWVLVAKMSSQLSLRDAALSSAISVGTAMFLGASVWYMCSRWPWPLHPSSVFYLTQIVLAIVYAVTWNLLICCVESLYDWSNLFPQFWASRTLGWQLLTGLWIYGVFAGVSYSVQTRNRLHEKELLATRAEALAARARMDAIRARLNPHFLFNALHTLAALAKFKPNVAEGAFERLGDMLRYALKDDKREVVEFSEEYNFTRMYLAFEQLRYEDRLKVEFDIDSQSFGFDIPPFSMQTLAENAVRHAISVRPEGGSIWIRSVCRDGRMSVTVSDDGPGEAAEDSKSHQLGLRSLRERLAVFYGSAAALETTSGPGGFEARFDVPAYAGERRQEGAGVG